MKITQMEVTLIDHMGTDLTVVNSAKVSNNRQSDWVEDDYGNDVLTARDEKLVGYLSEHNHFTPFCHCFATFRIKAPIFVARQLVKHQVGLAWNEISRRYVDEEPEFFKPTSWRERPDASMKQGSGNEASYLVCKLANEILEDSCSFAESSYKRLLALGVAPEQARMVLPQNMYTTWIETASLAFWARFCNLRLEAHAQKEINDVATLISANMKHLFPVSWDVLCPLN